MASFRAIFCQIYTLTEVWFKQDKHKSSIILQNSTHWTKLTLDSILTEQGLWARLTNFDQLVRNHGQMASNRVQRREGKGEKKNHTHQTPRCIPGRHGGAVPVRPTRRGRGKSSPERQRRHEEQPHLGCFDSRLLGHQPNQPHSFTMTTAEGRSQHQEKAGDEPNTAASAGRVPERDLASDLLGEETAGKAVWQRQERVERGAFCPRWRRRNSPESARIARRRRRRFRVCRRVSRGERGARARQVWVGLTDPGPDRLG
jgi:hypothetical protein